MIINPSRKLFTSKDTKLKSNKMSTQNTGNDVCPNIEIHHSDEENVNEITQTGAFDNSSKFFENNFVESHDNTSTNVMNDSSMMADGLNVENNDRMMTSSPLPHGKALLLLL